MEALIGIILLATLIEGTISYLFGNSEEGMSRPWLKYVSLIFGVLVSVAYNLDLPAMTGLVSPFPYVGAVVSGLIIGRGANYVNDLMALVRK
jgi:hypothetical protein